MSNATLREALEAARQFIVNGIEYGYIRMPDLDTPDTAHDTLPMIDAALAADDAARGEMREQFEEWLKIRESGRGYPADLWESWQASRAAAPQSVVCASDSLVRYYANLVVEADDAQALDSKLINQLRAALAAAPQSVEPVNQCDGCRAGMSLRGNLHIDKHGHAVMVCQQARYITSPPTAPTDAEWQEEAMRLAGEWVECTYKLAPDGAAIEALRAHLKGAGRE